jgi:Divergent InlB B-repeat domain
MTRGSAVRIFAAVLGLLALGVGGGSGGALATGQTAIQVQVIGGGQVTSDGGQITCGAGSTLCYYATTSTSGTVNLTAVEQAGWTFQGWSGCPALSGDNDEICTITLSTTGADLEPRASFSSEGIGTQMLTVTRPEGGDLNGDDIDCGSADSETDCTEIVLTGSTLTLVEDPDEGYAFGSWGGACGGSGPSCTVTMTADQAVSATFVKSASTFALTVSVTGNGTVAGPSIACTSAGGSSCSADEPAGTTLTLTAQPGSGASFNGWGGACAGTSPTCSVTMSSAQSVTASFSGGGPTPPATQFPLGVSVTGNGTVTGGGIECGSGQTTCTVNQTAGSTVTLSAAPDSGATFTSWGGACSGSATTCTVTMNAAKSVTATFTTSSGGGISLSVTVTGPGSVSGGGIQCGNGGRTCNASQDEDSTVTLTATPAANATFTGWDGACSGNDTTCTVTMDASKSVSAAFKSEGRTPVGVRTLSSRGRPVVRRTKNGWLVTLRFATAQGGRARVRATRAGRLQTALAFPVARGAATVGPFTVTRPGFYVFDLALGARRLRWTACLGRCGAAAHAGPFVLVRGPAKAVDAGALWSLTVKFHSTMPAAARLRIFRSGRLARDVRFAPSAGAITSGPFLLSPGTYQLRLAATDAYGRVRRLSWYAFLP